MQNYCDQPGTGIAALLRRREPILCLQQYLPARCDRHILAKGSHASGDKTHFDYTNIGFLTSVINRNLGHTFDPFLDCVGHMWNDLSSAAYESQLWYTEAQYGRNDSVSD